MGGLVGKWVMKDSGEYFRTGEIVEQLRDGYVLIRFDVPTQSDAPLLPLELVSMEEMAFAETKDNLRVWNIFEDEEEFDRYMAWLCEPSKKPDLTVVSIKDV
jgi:hypothetical protein